MPTYNQAAFVGESIESVLAQTYGNWELIVVNDGSTDGTAAILTAYAARDPRVKPVTRANGGVARALNTGIEQAAGEFVCWLSSDDLWVPDKLERQLNVYSRDAEAALVYSGWEIIDQCGRPIGSTRVGEYPDDSAFFELVKSNFINGCSVMIRRAVIEEVGRFDPAFTYAQDYEMWLRITTGRRIRLAAGLLVKTRVHPGQMSNDNRNEDDAVLAIRSHLANWTPERQFGGRRLSPAKRADILAKLACALRTRPTRPMPVEAREQLTKALAVGPHEADHLRAEWVRTLGGFGAGLFARGEVSRAEELFLEAIEDLPSDRRYSGLGPAQVWYNLGIVRLKQERWGEAELAFSRSARLLPNDPATLYHLAFACTCAGDPFKGETVLREVLRLVPDHRLARAGLAAVSAGLIRARPAGDGKRLRLNFHLGPEATDVERSAMIEVANALAKRDHLVTLIIGRGQPRPRKSALSGRLLILPADSGELPTGDGDFHLGCPAPNPASIPFEMAWVGHPKGALEIIRRRARTRTKTSPDACRAASGG
jgi:GT2 family glycosyltransferase